MTMRIAILLVFIMSSFEVSAQFGIRSNYNMNSYPGWERIIASSSIAGIEDQILSTGYELGLDYWFRLNNQRIEFYPTIYYSNSSSSTVSVEQDLDYFRQVIGFALNTHFYIFDFLGDCDCPTFKKEGTFFKKGLFVNLAPTLGLTNVKINQVDIPILNHEQLNLSIALGAGLDIGLNDLITITPTIQYRYTPSSDFPGLSAAHGIINIVEPDETSSIGQIQVGIRVGFRFDY